MISCRVAPFGIGFSLPMEAAVRAALAPALVAGAAEVQALARRNIARNFNQHASADEQQRDTGLSASIQTAIDAGRLEAVIGSDLVYAPVQEFGAHIEAVNAEYLTFQTEDGTWHRVKAVDIPPRPYLGPAVDEAVPGITAAVNAALGLAFGSP